MRIQKQLTRYEISNARTKAILLEKFINSVKLENGQKNLSKSFKNRIYLCDFRGELYAKVVLRTIEIAILEQCQVR